MVPSRVVGGISQSSSSSEILSQGGGPPRASTVPVSGDLSNTVLNSMAYSGPSVGENSLVAGSSSGISGGSHFQRSASINTESYMRLPSSPLSFSSNNVSIYGSAVIDGSNTQQKSHTQGTSSVNSLPSPQMGHLLQLPGGPRVASSFTRDPTGISHLQKKPCLDIKREDVLQQQAMQQLLKRQHDYPHVSDSSPHLHALIQQQRRQQEQQLIQSLSPMQRVQFLQQQHQQQQQQLLLRQQQQQQQQLLLRQQQPGLGIKRPFDGGVCSRRLMQYLYHQRQRPAENAIAYWRKFVAEYYSPRAKKRWCLSQYDNVAHHSPGVFPQASPDSWQCDICGSKSGRGFEATFEVLPRLNEIKFGSGVVDELLFLDLPREYRFPSGSMVLEYAKAVQESVYEQICVVREGQLRIVFSPELKILSWEFCARRHEELLPRRLVTPQVNQLLQAAQRCQSTISETGKDGVPQQDLQANSAMIVTAGRQLARSFESQSLNDLGFPKRYVRCLQIADVVNSMKDLIDFCRVQKVGPIEGLKNIPKRSTSEPEPMKMQEIENPTRNIQDLSQYILTRHNSMNSARKNPIVKQEPSTSSSLGSSVFSQNPPPPSQITRSHSMASANFLQKKQSLPPQVLQQEVSFTAQQSPSVQSGCDGFGFANSSAANGNGSSVIVDQIPSGSSSFKSCSNTESPAVTDRKATDEPPQKDDGVSQFLDDAFFDGVFGDDDVSFNWKV